MYLEISLTALSILSAIITFFIRRRLTNSAYEMLFILFTALLMASGLLTRAEINTLKSGDPRIVGLVYFMLFDAIAVLVCSCPLFARVIKEGVVATMHLFGKR